MMFSLNSLYSNDKRRFYALSEADCNLGNPIPYSRAMDFARLESSTADLILNIWQAIVFCMCTKNSVRSPLRNKRTWKGLLYVHNSAGVAGCRMRCNRDRLIRKSLRNRFYKAWRGHSKLDDKYGKLRVLIHSLINEATAVEDLYKIQVKSNKHATKTFLKEVHNRTYKMHKSHLELLNHVFRTGIESYPNVFQYIWQVVEKNLDDRFKWRPYMFPPKAKSNNNSNNNSLRNSNSNNNSNRNNNRNVEDKDDLYAPLLLHLGVIDLMNRVLQVLDKISNVPGQMNNGTPHR